MSFQSALSGLNAATTSLDAIGNNMANASTTGFKSSQAEFGDLYATSFGGVSKTATGSGVQVTDVKQDFSQGNINFTQNNLDLAISGNGFFVLNDNGQSLYTRAGSFSVDRDGYVVNAEGQRLEMYDVNSATGSVTNFTPSDLQLNLGENPANPTSTITMNLNLDATSSVPATTPFSATDSTSYNFSTSTTVYDSLGAAHEGTYYFVKSSTANTWDAYFSVDGTVLNSTSPAVLTFNSDGSLNTVTNASPMTGTFTPTNGASAMTFTSDFTGTTQYGATSAVNSLSQDGYTTGQLSGVTVDSSGLISANYTNGQSDVLGAVAMARFNNPNGLTQMGDSNWAQTFASGDVQAGQAGTGNFGTIQSGALESSNVNTSTELVNMIIAQRNYQANAKMLSTENQVTQDMINNL